MRVTTVLAFGAALSLALSPAIASTMNPAASLSLTDGQGAGVRAAAAGHSSTLVVVGAALAAVVVAAVAMGHNDSTPASA